MNEAMVLELIKSRRSTRKYKDTPVEPACRSAVRFRERGIR